MKVRTIILAAALAAAPSLLHAQFNFKVAGRDVAVHSFGSQGFMYSNDNNFLTTDTSKGSFSLTDFGANVSVRLGEKLRVGAQLYGRKVGQLGNGNVTMDWAVADYKIKDWFGIRAGRVKTSLGLFNDTQDMEFLHTWALLPQAVYPLDLRGETIAHEGADVYGNLGLKKLGSIAYTAYGGRHPGDVHGGWIYGLNNNKTHVNSYAGGPQFGADLRWNTPVKGVMVGSSLMSQDMTTDGTNTYAIAGVLYPTPYAKYTRKDHTTAFYTEYTLGNFRFDGEYRRQWKANETTQMSSPTAVVKFSHTNADGRFGYVSAAYRFTKWLEMGTYHSRYIADWRAYHGTAANHLFDQAVTARFDLMSCVDLKVEGHFMDGNGGAKTNRGFYPIDNPAGIADKTRLLVVRLGFHL